METGLLWDRSTWILSVENSSKFALRIHSTLDASNLGQLIGHVFHSSGHVLVDGIGEGT